jgi:hypothetical protein
MGETMTDRRPRRRRNRFQLVLVPAVSAALLAFGCDRSQTPVKICVDPQGRRLPDGQCWADDRVPSTFHHWYRASGAGAIPVGAFIHSSSGFHSSFHSSHSVSRGGFGSSAHSHSSGS